MKKFTVLTIAIIMMTFAILGLSQDVNARTLNATSPGLGAADSFSVLAALSANSATNSTLQGDLGLSPGLEISRTGAWTVGGSEYFGPSSLAFDAQGSALGAFNNLAGQGTSGTFDSTTIAPVPGVWTNGSSATFTGTLTLTGGYEDVWVFQIPSDLTFGGEVVMAGDAQACHVFWQVGRDATIQSGTRFVGTIIASRDITVVSGATVSGRVMSLNGAITLDANTISMPPCASAPQAPVEEVNATSIPAVVELPGTGGSPLQSQALPIGLAVIFGGLSVFATVLIIRAMRRNSQL